MWVPVPFLVRARRPGAWAAVSGVLATVALVLRGDGVSPLVGVAVLVLVAAALGAALAAVRAAVRALGQGPGDGMSAYGAGRRVEVIWASRRREHGRIEVEDVGHGEVVALFSGHGDEPPHVAVRLGGHDLLLQGGPGPGGIAWYTIVDDAGYTLARADASPGPGNDAPVDWTIRPGHGPALRLRHRRGARPARVTLLDRTGGAWWVREGRRAELPDELDPVSAVFVVLLIDQLGRGAPRDRSS